MAENTVFKPEILNAQILQNGNPKVDWIIATIKTDEFGRFSPPQGWKIDNITAPKKQILELEIVRYK